RFMSIGRFDDQLVVGVDDRRRTLHRYPSFRALPLHARRSIEGQLLPLFDEVYPISFVVAVVVPLLKAAIDSRKLFLAKVIPEVSLRWIRDGSEIQLLSVQAPSGLRHSVVVQRSSFFGIRH